ncbi:MAG: indolepyruvate ferredoxin oxidoreductase family protein, partial [Alphaproteobacteria bacterium]|nr:indolepyruvate ferredoxin oxidoreductase family protein [Alphaproteobacteria bacterium]
MSVAAQSFAEVSLDDKYTKEEGRIFVNGVQALVRLPLLQKQRDRAAGLNTGGFISGYRGSPLGGYDQAMWKAEKFLRQNDIKFQPGLNEDLAAASVWGSQQVTMFPGAEYDGVFGIWYGKGPGVDRTGDAFKHGNYAGTSKHGGVLVLTGDDHAAKSSTLPHQSEHAFMGAMIPVLNPSSIQEYLDMGLMGIAMSRYSGCWVAFKTITETVESSVSVSVDPDRVQIIEPEDFEMPEDGLSIRWPDPPLEQESRLLHHKLYAVLAFARANKLDRVELDSPNPRFGIMATGKAYGDVRQALNDLGIDEATAAEIGIRVYKVGMSWPLEKEGARAFAEGLEEVLVVEEKRAFIENQLKEQLYNWKEDTRPRVVGKFDEDGNWLLDAKSELTPAQVARAIAARIKKFHQSSAIDERLAFLENKERVLAGDPATLARLPYFCSGCPHNTSTKVPDGSFAMAGIGCHYMAVWMDRSTLTATHMGAEGTPWIGMAPFTSTKHMFQNLGDGTYFHSGYLAIRASVAAGVNITYKILYNDATAMTGGQPHEGEVSVPEIAWQVHSEGVKKIVIVSDEPEKYGAGAGLPSGITFHHRKHLDPVQRELREMQGTTVMIYDQTCAAEKRRRRKRGKFPDPAKRAFINDAVCDGCGDCSVQSNCLSVEPLETVFGRKRVINQSSCNKDYSCVTGFCPSFVTVHGGNVRKPKSDVAANQGPMLDLPEPEAVSTTEPYNMLVTGVGGTGVVTIGALLGMAAHIEGKGVSVLDMTGLAQKGGAVMTHVRISDNADDIHTARLGAGAADAVLGCDMVVAGSFDALAKMQNGSTRAVINSHETPTAGFTQDNELQFPGDHFKQMIKENTGDNLVDFIDATKLATALIGDAIATNLFTLGYAYQRGMVPVSGAAIEKAIELNGVSVETGLDTFRWGRTAAFDLKAAEAAAAPAMPIVEELTTSPTLEHIVARRSDELVQYQDAAYAERYRAFVAHVAVVEKEKGKGLAGLAEAVARNYFKLLAYKDEYEVARLFTDPAFMEKIKLQFGGDYTLKFHMAPPLLARPDPLTGKIEKMEFGPWMMKAFGLLAKLKGLRGGTFDIFGYTEERKTERQLIVDYEQTVLRLLDGLTTQNHSLAVLVASVPEHIRGFGRVKQEQLATAKTREADLLAEFENPTPNASAA